VCIERRGGRGSGTTVQRRVDRHDQLADRRPAIVILIDRQTLLGMRAIATDCTSSLMLTVPCRCSPRARRAAGQI
jgi:hypothetical protein